MNSRIFVILRRLTKRMWFRATAFSLLAIVSALLAIVLTPYIPSGLSTSIGADAVDDVLTIIASSMLAVTTFSLGIAVSAYNSAASGATPRATALLVEDSTTQNVLSTFLGAFLFSLVGIIVLRTGAYGDQGRVVLYLFTIFVIVVVVGTLLRWIGHLTHIGRMNDTLERVEAATRNAMRTRLSAPYLGCTPLPDGYRLPHGNFPVHAEVIGYVQNIDVGDLAETAADLDTKFAISALPGTFASPAREIIFSERQLTREEARAVEDCFTIANNRSFDDDPRFGIVVLAEIASRALSPAVNDPGTAIDVVGRLVRLLHQWNAGLAEASTKVNHPALYAPGLALKDLFDDAFTSVARDGAGIVEVQMRIQKALAAFAASSSPESVRIEARRHADMSLERAEAVLTLDVDRERIRALRRTGWQDAPPAVADPSRGGLEETA